MDRVQVVEDRRAGLDGVQLARIDLGDQGNDVHFDNPGLPRGLGQPMQQLVVREGLQNWFARMLGV